MDLPTFVYSGRGAKEVGVLIYSALSPDLRCNAFV